MKQADPWHRLRGARRRRVVLLALLAAVAALLWFWGPLTRQAQAGAAYGARIGCSCHYIGGRTLDDCRKDFLPGMGMVILSEDASARSVTARIIPIASETAVYREGEGCTFARGD